MSLKSALKDTGTLETFFVFIKKTKHRELCIAAVTGKKKIPSVW